MRVLEAREVPGHGLRATELAVFEGAGWRVEGWTSTEQEGTGLQKSVVGNERVESESPRGPAPVVGVTGRRNGPASAGDGWVDEWKW